MERQWVFINQDYDKAQLSSLVKKLRMSPAICMALLNRGITPDNADGYFSASPEGLHDPFLMADMEKAAARLREAIDKGEKVCVYGDYDADGVSASAMLCSYLRSKGAVCSVYIPLREGEGYGVNSEAVKKIAKSGAKLIVTVDTGISAVRETAEAKALGMDVIITDHHECGASLPPACAVCDPKRPDCPYPFKALSGTGVAFKLICAVEGDTEKCLKKFSEYVAFATVADVVDLLGENRTLVKIGMEKIKREPIFWLDTLMEMTRIKKKELTSFGLAFMVAPRINAAGRMKNAYTALNFLKSRDMGRGVLLCVELDVLNDRRKNTGDKILAEALGKISQTPAKKVLVLSGEGWHSGVIGIVAARISEMYHRNVVMISVNGGIGSGSARAIEGFNLYDALSSCSHLLEKFGGHAKAAGLTLKEENIALFDDAINKYADSVMTPESLIPKIYIDCAISCETSLEKLCREQLLMEPFGEANERPVFAVLGARINPVRKTRDRKHLMMSITKNGNSFPCIGFGMGDLADGLRAGDIIDLAAGIELNEYMGRTSPQFHISDIKKR